MLEKLDAIEEKYEELTHQLTDPELLADLCAPKWSLSTAGILIESKDEIAERIGRSTDCGDAVVMACWIDRRGAFSQGQFFR